MSLTTGRGPLSARPAGRFTVSMPENVSYIEPFRRRVRATKNGRTLIDSERVVLLHRPGRPPTFAFPAHDVTDLATEDERDVPRLCDRAVGLPSTSGSKRTSSSSDIRGIPYHRVDCLRSSRRLRVEAAGATLVDTTETMVVYETALEPRLYVHPRFVQTELTRSQLQTYCPYKGTATYWNAVVDGTPCCATSPGATRMPCRSPNRCSTC